MRASRSSLPLTALIVIIVIVAGGCDDSPTRATRTHSTPEPEPFVIQLGSDKHDESHDIAVDPDGNVFVTGGFSGAVEFPGYTFNPDKGQVFLIKFDPTGEFQWAQNIPGVYGDGPLRLATDPSGDVTLQSVFATTVTIDLVTVKSQGGGEHTIMARFNPDGRLKWISYDTGTYMSVGFDTDAGGDGGIATTGFFQIGAEFGGTELATTGFGFFLVRYDMRGNAVWAKQSEMPTGSGNRVAVDDDGNIVVAGSYQKSFKLDTIEITTESGGNFIARYAPTGDLAWLKDFDGSLHAIATDRNGDIYLGGYNSTSSMLWKLDTNGNVVWESPTEASTRQIAVAPSGDVLVSGWFGGTMTVGSDQATSNGFYDFFIARYDAAGQGVSLVAGGSTLDDRAMGLAVDRYGASLSVIDFQESFEFQGETISSAGNYDILVMRME